MKITTFNPMIVTRDAESVIKLFEELGFEKRHQKSEIGDESVTDVRMKDKNGFYVDILQADDERTMIRINVDDMTEAIDIFLENGFRRVRRESASKTVDTGSSIYNVLISPSGTVFTVSQHIKD
jgi:predicted RNA binding protein YcfA (HicA-like mRNA interferase family)